LIFFLYISAIIELEPLNRQQKMAQKLKNQKSKKISKPAKVKQAAKSVHPKKAGATSKKTKIVKKAAPVSKAAAKSSLKKNASAPAKALKSSVKTKIIPAPATKSKKSAPVAAPKPAKAAKVISPPAKLKTSKSAAPIVVAPVQDIRNLPTIKRPGAGQVQQRRTPGNKQQKKVFRTELIFPNQLRETPLAKVKKAEPKGKFELEFLVKSSPTLLFDFLSTPSGLSEWFADDVDIRNEEFTFHWDGQVQRAKLLAYKQDHLLRLRWIDKNEDFYFEFRIEQDDMTGDVTLIVTDFGESEDDMRTSRLLWESQVNKLLKVLGAY
jgi:uncharacterized protein YndB with AHSA1/START domain